MGVTVCTTALVGALASPVVAAGDDNGVADLSAEEIAREARKAVKGLSSVHVEADVQARSVTSVRELDLSMDRDANCTGTVEQYAGSFELIRQGDKLWIQPDERWIDARLPGLTDRAKSRLRDGAYIATTVKSPQGAEIAPLCDLDGIERRLSQQSEKAAEARLTKGSTTKVEGKPVIQISARTDTVEAEAFIATEGKPYPLRITGRSKAENATIAAEFSDFDKSVKVKAPPADKTIGLRR
ncbi:hypothetical protein [Streptomyces sp. NPDC002851]